VQKFVRKHIEGTYHHVAIKDAIMAATVATGHAQAYRQGAAVQDLGP